MKKFLSAFLLLISFLVLPSVKAADLQSIDNIVGHYPNKINAVFSDIDGTLMEKEYKKGEAPESAKLAIKKLHNTNIPLILTTGRSYTDTQELAKALGSKSNYLITLQGAEIINPQGKIIYKDCIKNKDAKNILNNLEFFINTKNLNSKIYFYVDGKVLAKTKFNLPYTWDKIVVIKTYESIGRSTPSKIGVYDKNINNLELIKNYLQTNYPDYYVYLSTTCFCELTTKTATKGNGVKQVAKLLEQDLKNVAVFGDAENDISMLSAVKKSGGLAVAVKNAMENLKKNANYETSSAIEGGVNHAVDEIIENNKLLNRESK